MTDHFDQARVELDRDVFLCMAAAQGATVVCLEGCLWITRDGCPEDIQLVPGQSYLVEGASPVVVCGFGPSLARVMQPAPQCRPVARRRLAALLPPWGRRFAAA